MGKLIWRKQVRPLLNICNPRILEVEAEESHLSAFYDLSMINSSKLFMHALGPVVYPDLDSLGCIPKDGTGGHLVVLFFIF